MVPVVTFGPRLAYLELRKDAREGGIVRGKWAQQAGYDRSLYVRPATATRPAYSLSSFELRRNSTS